MYSTVNYLFKVHLALFAHTVWVAANRIEQRKWNKQVFCFEKNLIQTQWQLEKLSACLFAYFCLK